MSRILDNLKAWMVNVRRSGKTDSVLCVLAVGQPGHSALVITARMRGRGAGLNPKPIVWGAGFCSPSKLHLQLDEIIQVKMNRDLYNSLGFAKKLFLCLSYSSGRMRG